MSRKHNRNVPNMQTAS